MSVHGFCRLHGRALAVLLSLGLFSAAAAAAPSAQLWPRWQKHDAGSTHTIDESAFDAFLKKYVVVHDGGPNGVRYGKVSTADRHALDQYIKTQEAVKIDGYNRDVQRAYWINLYNAETLKLVLDHYPVSSIRKIDGGFFNHGPWDEKLLQVEGEKLSLNDIEHRILRPIWHDSLTHYGVNCASMSCPSLLDHAYTGADVTATLKANAHKYINSPEGVSFNGGALTVSSIFDWYSGDFGKDPQAVIGYLKGYAAPALAAKLANAHTISHYAYNWSLNDEKDIGGN